MFSVNDILLNEFQFKYKMSENLINWSVKEVSKFLKAQIESKEILTAISEEKIDGKTLLLLNERDLYTLEAKYKILLGDLKKFSLVVHKLQSENRNCLVYLGLIDRESQQQVIINNLLNTSSSSRHNHSSSNYPHHHHHSLFVSDRNRSLQDVEISPDNSVDGSSSSKCFASCIQPEFFKTVVSLGEHLISELDNQKLLNHQSSSLSREKKR
jgi:hypothetical protein